MTCLILAAAIGAAAFVAAAIACRHAYARGRRDGLAAAGAAIIRDEDEFAALAPWKAGER